MTNPATPATQTPTPRSGIGRADRPLLGIASMAFGVVLLSVMDAVTKYAILHMPTGQLMAIRSVIVLLILTPFVIRAGGLSALRTKRPLGHLLRACLSVCAMYSFFESLRHLPLATAIAIGFAAPLFMTALSVPVLKEKVGIHRWSAVFVGFIGVMVIIGPGIADGEFGIGAMLALSAAVFYAGGMTCVRWLASTETDLSMMVSQNAAMLCGGLAGAAIVAVPVPGHMWFVILTMAVLVMLGQLFTIRAFRLAPVGAVAPFHYTELVWAALLGWVFWGEWPSDNVWWGAAVVVAAGLYTIWRERVRAAAVAANAPAA
ncbi:MAG: DMT family transporter [Alphaproteobacteria bacterium]|nr:DMT family transporter [Alphaproteobacteria bacterium]